MQGLVPSTSTAPLLAKTQSATPCSRWFSYTRKFCFFFVLLYQVVRKRNNLYCSCYCKRRFTCVWFDLQFKGKRNSLYCSFYCERSFVCLIYHSVERKEKQNVVLSLLWKDSFVLKFDLPFQLRKKWNSLHCSLYIESFVCRVAAKGFYLKYDEMKTDPNVQKWDVHVLTVSAVKTMSCSNPVSRNF